MQPKINLAPQKHGFINKPFQTWEIPLSLGERGRG